MRDNLQVALLPFPMLMCRQNKVALQLTGHHELCMNFARGGLG